MTLPTLYSLTSLGQTQTWSIEFSGGKFRTTEGIKGGAMTVSEWTVCEGKNLGKKNETSPEVQAEKEARAKWKKKTESGYWENEADIHKAKFFEPMLAHKWVDYSDTKFPLLCGPKLDGGRCVITKDGMFSRNGKPIVSCPHIFEAIKGFLADKKIVIDGELYNHDLRHDFNKIISLIKKSKPTTADLEESKRLVQFWAFDIVEVGNERVPFSVRAASYEMLCGLPDMHEAGFRAVSQKLVQSFDEAKEYFAEAIEQGYEGIMLRVPDSPYENKRSRFLLKYKEFIDAEFEILDIEEGKGNRSGMFGRFICKLPDGRTFEANSRGNEAYYTDLWKNKSEYIGQMATIRYQNLTPDGKPRFGVCVGVRNYE